MSGEPVPNFILAEDEIDFILKNDVESSQDEVYQLFDGDDALCRLEEDDKAAASGESFSRTLYSMPGVSRTTVSQSPPPDATFGGSGGTSIENLGGSSPDRVDRLFDIEDVLGGDNKVVADECDLGRTLDSARPGFSRMVSLSPDVLFEGRGALEDFNDPLMPGLVGAEDALPPFEDLDDIGIDFDWTPSDEVLQKLRKIRRDVQRKSQKDRWGRRAHNFQTCKKTIKGVEIQGAAAINKAQFAAGKSPVQTFWADVTAPALEEIKKKKQDTWTTKIEKSWSEERRQQARNAWAAQSNSKKEERKKKQQASLASTLENQALDIQRTIDEKLGAAGVLNRCASVKEEDVPSPNPKAAGAVPGPKPQAVGCAPKPKAQAAGAGRCKLCTKFAPGLVRTCPGRDAELNCVYFQSDGTLKHTVCPRCSKHKGAYAQRCKGGRQGENKCQFYKKNGRPRKTDCGPLLKRALTC